MARALRYTIIVMDDDIAICEVRFNDQDLANIIGEQLTRLIANIMPQELTDEELLLRQADEFWRGRHNAD